MDRKSIVGPLRDRRSLPAQMIAGFVMVVVVTTMTIGLPAMWLIRQQLEEQAWKLVEQGQRASKAFCDTQQHEVIAFAQLVAERPTLHRLMGRDDRRDLLNYLITLEKPVEFDLVAVCDSGGKLVVSTDVRIEETICSDDRAEGISTIRGGSGVQVLMMAVHPIPLYAQTGGKVIIARRMDDDFATQMRAFTSLETTLILDQELVATSFDQDLPIPVALSIQPEVEEAPGEILQGRSSIQGQPYFTGMSQSNCLGLAVAVALPIANIVQTQNRLVGFLIGGLMVVAALGSVLGIHLARRISRPLVSLAELAAGLSQGDLTTPVKVKTGVREAALVAQALEDSRVSVLQTLTELRNEKVWSNNLLESIGEGIMTVDSDMRITFFSHAAEQITGWQSEQVLQHSCNDFFKLVEEDLPFSQVLPPPGQRIKVVALLAGGRIVSLALTGARLSYPTAREPELAVVFRDISQEDLVHRLLGHFISNVVHEFRTPLAALNASLELLLDKEDTSRPAERHKLLKGLQVSVVNLQTLVDNLLESASFEAGHFRVSPRPFDLSDLITVAVRIMQPLLEKYNQQLLVKLPAFLPLVQADPRRMVQVLVNLLSNASKYGPANLEIILSASVENGFVRVKVDDRGPGISPEQRATLFRRFAYPETRHENLRMGAGLGLSVVKAIVEAHGGQTGVDNPSTGGTTFWFTLPIATEI